MCYRWEAKCGLGEGAWKSRGNALSLGLWRKTESDPVILLYEALLKEMVGTPTDPPFVWAIINHVLREENLDPSYSEFM